MNSLMSFPTIPGFRITGEIAPGGMATVYKGISESNGESVAIKVMAPVLGADPSFRRRFLEECQITQELKHKNIIRILAFGCIDSIYYMVMAHLPGGTLADRLKMKIPENEAVSILAQVAEALGHAHDKGVVHRDVKPSNILFDRVGVAILSDFGIAKAVIATSNATRAGMVIGTPDYMSPEQSAGKTLDGRSDLYSLGIVFYEMLVGELPYKAEDPLALALKHRDDPLPQLPIRLSKFQPTFERLLAKQPDDRFPDAAALLAALDQNTSDRLPPTILRPQIEPQVTPKIEIKAEVKPETREEISPSRSWWRATLAVVVTVAAIGVAVWWLSTRPQLTGPRAVQIGSTSEEIDAALALCSQYRQGCQRAWYEDEKIQTVALAPFALDETEVTNEEFAEFVAATGYSTDAEKLGYSTRLDPQLLAAIEVRGYSWKTPDGPGSSYRDRLNHPVTNMSYSDADAYCRWRAARLPTAPEWEYAARGDSRRIFPWGAEWNPVSAQWQNGQATGTLAVGSIASGRTPDGLADLAGNVWEWTSTQENGQAVLKGGSWAETNPANLRAAARRLENPNIPAVDNGFRCARDVEAWPK